MNDQFNPDPDFSPQQSMAVIQSMISAARNKFSENGHLYLLWGWVVFVCSIAQFVLMNYFNYEYHYMVWMLTWGAFIYQFIYLARNKRKEKVKTYADRVVGFVWMAFVVLMFLFGFLFGRELGDNYYRMVSPGFLALYGMPTFLSGIILNFRPLIIGGVFCWLLSVAGAYIPYDYQLLLLSAAMIVAWIIPGYILRMKYKKKMPDMEEKQLSGHESLALINQMISKAKNEINDNGIGWLLWGGMIFLASFSTYLIIELNLDVDLYIGWNVFGLIAIPLMIYNFILRKKHLKTKTYVDDLLYLFDVGFTICIFLIILSINVAVPPNGGFGYFLMIYGFLMLIQGGAIRFRPLFVGAVINWAGAIGIFFTTNFKYDMLITAAAVFIGYIIPGLMLRSKYKKRVKQVLS